MVGTVESDYSRVRAYRVGNLVFLHVSLWYKYLEGNVEYEIPMHIDINSLLDEDEQFITITDDLHGKTLNQLTLMGQTERVEMGADPFSGIIHTIASGSGTYVKDIDKIYTVSKK